MTKASFNSKLVRLKVWRIRASSSRHGVGFNSKLVRLKANGQGGNSSAIAFQFQTGAIKREQG